MKKVLLFAAAVIGGVLLWRRLEEQREGRQMWHEVTDPMPSRST